MEGFADIESPVRIGLLALIGWTALIILLVTSLTLLLYYYLRQRNRGRRESDTPKASPLEIALNQLEKLRSACGQLEADPFVVKVSDVVRNYLEAALSVPAKEQTSEEFLHTLQTQGNLPGILQNKMPAFLDQCDRVKFAQQSLGDEQKWALLETASTVVTETNQDLSPFSPGNKEGSR